MATADKLKSYVTDIANAIRAKEGSTEKINPQDFVQRIENLQVGGGASESSIEYLDVSGIEESNKTVLCGFGYLGKTSEGILPIPIMLTEGLGSIPDKLSPVKSISIDFSTDLFNGFTIKTFLYQVGIAAETLDSIPRLTKEQFYTLE